MLIARSKPWESNDCSQLAAGLRKCCHWQIWIEDFAIGKWTDSKAFGPVSRTLPFACLPRWMVHLAGIACKAVCEDLAGRLASYCASLKCPNCFLKRVRTRRDSAFMAESNYFWESLYNCCSSGSTWTRAFSLWLFYCIGCTLVIIPCLTCQI